MLGGLLTLLSFSLLPLLSVNAQCDNYGVQNGTTCACPPGFGGPTCAFPVCGGNLFDGASRELVQPANGALYSNASSCSCPDGWAGVGCNVCQSSDSCNSAYTAHFGSGTADLTGAQTDSTITCSNSLRVYGVGQLSCSVNNPTIGALYPGKTSLTVLRNLDSSKTLASNVTSFGAAKSLFAQLWYNGEEQFFCQADTCDQAVADGSADWNCKNLQCVCRANATFCGARPAASIANVINGLNGDLELKCSTAEDGSLGCALIQETITQVFGSSGLGLQNCNVGECIRQAFIDEANNNGTTTSEESSQAKELSGGVVAGLAVVGALVLAFILLFIWGWLVRRKARKGGDGKVMETGGVAVHWSTINYSVPASSGDKHILNDLTGEVHPGEVLAILGPSGAGKTTLIEILGGKAKLGKATGAITFTKAATSEPVASPRIGYVDQSDILPSMLTVQEALLFAAKLRLPEWIPLEQKEAKVHEVMKQLGILDIKDTRIGNQERRGISGGEQRRVSIGLELVASPDILVLDEPTSGLDSVSANKVISVLRELSHDPSNPTAIIASIHQPNSKLYQLFDKVLVLSHGQELYFGKGGLAPVEYFTQHGHPMQEGYNVADHLLDIASEPTDEVLASSKRKAASRGSATTTVEEKTLSGNPEANRPTVQEVVTGSSDVEKTAGGDPKESSSVKERKLGGAKLSSTYSSTFLTQLGVLCGREWKILRRDWSLFFAHLAVSAVLGVFCGGLYFNTGITIAGFQSRVGCLFFLGSLLSFSALSALYNLIEIRPLFLRERAGSYYSPTAWLLSRFFFDVIPLRILPTIVVSTIVYWMAGLAPDAAHFFKFLFILVLFTFAMTLFNFLLACTFRNGGIAILLSALFNLFIMTFAGFFVHLSDIPPVLRWLQWFSVLKYCLEALAVNEVGAGLQIVDSLQGVPVNVSAQLIMNLLFGFGSNNYYRDVLVLFAFIAGFGIAVISIVYVSVRERR